HWRLFMDFRTNKYTTSSCLVLIAFAISFCFIACNEKKTPPPKKEIVETPQQMSVKVPEIIQKIIGDFDENNKMDDSVQVFQPSALQSLYEKSNYAAYGSKEQQWLPLGDSLTNLI